MREEIQDLISKYSVFVDDRKLSQVVDLFVEDGYVSVTGKVVTNGLIEMRGHAEIAAWLNRLTDNGKGGPVGKHCLSNMLVTINANTASSQTDMMFVKQAADGRRWDVWELARYYDEFVRTPSGWRFKSRNIAIFP